MQRRFPAVIAMVLAALVGLLLGPTTASAATWPTVSRGETGEQVKTIQYLLTDHGYATTADGIFGSGTETNVKSFQSANGLTADGAVGPGTWPKLVVTVQNGSSGSAAKAAQTQLNRYGYGLAVDGAFGPASTAAATDFQTKHGLTADGIVNEATWNALVGVSDTPHAAPNNNPDFLQVYDANIENLPTVDLQCPGDWEDLVYYLQLQEYRPDVYIIQQISNQTQLNALTQRLSTVFGEQYSGVIAEANPAIGPQECGPPKYYQTNAIIYRTARLQLTLDTNRTWQAQAQDSSGNCPNNTQARTKAVKAMFHDKIANKDLTVASLHWPTAASDGPPCATQNAAEVNTEMTEDGYGGSLQIAAGDLNYTDTATSGGTDYRTWYKSMNGDLGGAYHFRDAMYASCVASGDPLGPCLAGNWTLSGTRRIDFVFARRADGSMPAISGQHTPTFDEGDAADVALTGDDRADRNYSDHRAVMARVHY